MKKNILTITSAWLLSASAFAQILNPGFENWTSQGSYSTPDNWGNLNATTSFASVYTCNKGTPGNPGTSYVKLSSKSVPGIGVVPGLIASGTLNVTSMKASGFAYTTRSQNFTGSWQFMSSGSDTGMVSVVLSAWNSSMNMRDTIAYSMQKLSGMVMSWTNFSLPLTYLSSANPDTVTIILSSSGPAPVAGSYLYVDNLAFNGTVAGIKNISAINSVSIYPNPATDHAAVEFYLSKTSSLKLQVIDLSGKIVKEISEASASGMIKRDLDLAGMAKGLYFVKIATENGTEVRKITIE